MEEIFIPLEKVLSSLRVSQIDAKTCNKLISDMLRGTVINKNIIIPLLKFHTNDKDRNGLFKSIISISKIDTSEMVEIIDIFSEVKERYTAILVITEIYNGKLPFWVLYTFLNKVGPSNTYDLFAALGQKIDKIMNFGTLIGILLFIKTNDEKHKIVKYLKRSHLICFKMNDTDMKLLYDHVNDEKYYNQLCDILDADTSLIPTIIDNPMTPQPVRTKRTQVIPMISMTPIPTSTRTRHMTQTTYKRNPQKSKS